MGAEKTIDEVLEEAGGFGRFQWRLLLMLAYCMSTLALQALSMTFLASEPSWKCVSNSTTCKFNSTITSNMKDYSSKCELDEYEWFYNAPSSSIVSQYQLHCDQSILKNIATSMVYLGWFFGSIIFGIISDKFGRRIALLISMSVMATSGTLSSFPNIFWLFATLKFFTGSGIGGAMMCIFILNTEYTGPKKRALAGIIVWNFWIVGLSLLALFAFLIKDWKYLNLATSVPAFAIIIFGWFIPESARWYLVQGQTEKALEALRRVANVNGRSLHPNTVLEQACIQGRNSGNVFHLFSKCSLAVYTLVCLFVWFTCSMTYYGISLNTSALGGNIYFVFFLTSIVAIPANFLATFLIDKYGRKKIMIIGLLIAALAMITAALFPRDTNKDAYSILRVSMAMVSKFMLTIAFDAAYLITYEILPTTLRNAGMGMSSAAARIGSFSASFVIYLKTTNWFLPFIVFGLLGFLAAILCMILPETNHKPTKETLNDDLCEKNIVITNNEYEQSNKDGIELKDSFL